MTPPIAATEAKHAHPYSLPTDHRLAHNNTGYVGRHAFRGQHADEYSVFSEEASDALWHIYSAPLMPWPAHRAVSS